MLTPSLQSGLPIIGQTRMNRIRVLLLNERSLFRASLGHLLASEGEFEIAAECATPAQALEVLKHDPVDVVLLDFESSEEPGNNFIEAARRGGYQGRLLIVARAIDALTSAAALTHGASGIFPTSAEPNRLIQAIKMVAAGELWIDPKVTQSLAEWVDLHSHSKDHDPHALDDREQEVLEGIVSGLTNRKIGDNMGHSESAVKNVVQRLFSKAGVHKRSQLVRAAIEGSLGRTSEVER